MSYLQEEGIKFVESPYIELFNIDNYKIGMCLYKNNNKEAAEQ